MLCPKDCLKCNSSNSCETCKPGMLFYQKPYDPPANTAFEFYCGLPYKDLKIDDKTIYQTKSFLFKPQSFFVFFTKEMNFTKDIEKFSKYFIPTVKFDRSRTKAIGSRLLQNATF